MGEADSQRTRIENTRYTIGREGAKTVTAGERPLSLAMIKKLVRVSSLWRTCSFSTSSMLYPVRAAILATEGRRDSNTLNPKTGPPFLRIFLAGLIISDPSDGMFLLSVIVKDTVEAIRSQFPTQDSVRFRAAPLAQQPI